MKRMMLALVLLTLSLTAPMACMDGDPGPGRVEVKWLVEGSTCSKAGLAEVKVALMEEGTTVLTKETRCSDQSLVFEDVPVGVYDIQVRGYDEEGIPTYEGSYEGLAVKSGNTASTPDTTIKLKAKKGTLLLAWSFPSDKPSICSFNNVQNLEVNVWQAGTVVDLFAGEFPCDPAYGEPDDLPAPFENGWVVISDIPPGEVDLLLFGLSPEGERLYFGEEQVMMPNTGNVQVIVELETCNGNCI